jgi:hypothetical protein
MLRWWYGSGWLRIIQSMEENLRTIAQVFAVKVLIRTWFSPWKQIYTPSTFLTFFRSAIDNLVSRFIGTTVRSIILFAALILSILVLVVGCLSLLLWPLIPLLIFIFPMLTSEGIF